MVAKANESNKFRTLIYGMILTWNLFWALGKDKRLTSLGKVCWSFFWEKQHYYQKGIVGFTQFVNRCVAHWHFWKFTEEGATGKLRVFNSR